MTTKSLPTLQSRIAAFKGRVNKLATKAPPRRARFATDADVELLDLYSPIDAPHTQADEAEGRSDYLDGLGLPGEYPFTRGVQPNMYRGRLWTMRQYAGFGSAKDSNQRYHYLLSRGQTGLSVAFDLPTQMGRDPDHELSSGEVGRVGVSIASLSDMRVLLSGLPLDKITTSMTINSTAATLLALYVAVADEQGVSRKLLGGTVQNDILKEYMARGTYIYPPRPSLRLITDLFSFCHAELPQWNTISISGYHIREAGCDAVQEVAFTLADGIAYVEAAMAVGLKVDEFAPRLSFFFNGHNNLIEEVAKFRAARRLWARIMRERFSAKDEKSQMLRFHCQTAGSMLTAQQPLCNVVRNSVQALGAILGGCQSLHVNGYDEALALPSEQSGKRNRAAGSLPAVGGSAGKGSVSHDSGPGSGSSRPPSTGSSASSSDRWAPQTRARSTRNGRSNPAPFQVTSTPGSSVARVDSTRSSRSRSAPVKTAVPSDVASATATTGATRGSSPLTVVSVSMSSP